jgi:protease I
MQIKNLSNRHDLQGKRVAVLAADGFEQSELMVPIDALESCGARIDVITPEGEAIRGWEEEDWGQTISADVALDDAVPEDYDALLLPGGVINSDALRMLPAAREFTAHFLKHDKHAFVICHGAQVLIDAGVVKDRTMTSYQAIATDLKNAGAKWLDEEVVQDGKFITSRSPDDLPAFCARICAALDDAKGHRTLPVN